MNRIVTSTFLISVLAVLMLSQGTVSVDAAFSDAGTAGSCIQTLYAWTVDSAGNPISKLNATPGSIEMTNFVGRYIDDGNGGLVPYLRVKYSIVWTNGMNHEHYDVHISYTHNDGMSTDQYDNENVFRVDPTSGDQIVIDNTDGSTDNDEELEFDPHVPYGHPSNNGGILTVSVYCRQCGGQASISRNVVYRRAFTLASRALDISWTDAGGNGEIQTDETFTINLIYMACDWDVSFGTRVGIDTINDLKIDGTSDDIEKGATYPTNVVPGSGDSSISSYSFDFTQRTGGNPRADFWGRIFDESGYKAKRIEDGDAAPAVPLNFR